MIPAVLNSSKRLAGAFLVEVIGEPPPPPPPGWWMGIRSGPTAVNVGSAEEAVATLRLFREGSDEPVPSVSYRIVGVGDNPVQGADFAAGVLPTATVEVNQPLVDISIRFAARTPPAVEKLGTIELYGPVNGNIRIAQSTLNFRIAAQEGGGSGDPGGDNTDVGYAFGSDWEVNWAEHADHAFSPIVQLTNGIQLRGGGGTDVTERGRAVFTKKRWTNNNWRVTFLTEKLHSNLPTSGQVSEIFLLFYFGMQGKPPQPNDLAQWPQPFQAYSHNYRDETVAGGRVTFNYQTVAAPSQDTTLNLAIFTPTGIRNISPLASHVYQQRTGQRFAYTIEKVGRRLRASREGGNNDNFVVVWEDATIEQYATIGNFGFLANALMDAEI